MRPCHVRIINERVECTNYCILEWKKLACLLSFFLFAHNIFKNKSVYKLAHNIFLLEQIGVQFSRNMPNIAYSFLFIAFLCTYLFTLIHV
jgi:hypothetical protein